MTTAQRAAYLIARDVWFTTYQLECLRDGMDPKIAYSPDFRSWAIAEEWPLSSDNPAGENHCYTDCGSSVAM